MSDPTVLARGLARIRKAGGDVDTLRPVAEDFATAHPDAEPDEILEAARASVPEAFQKAGEANGEPPEVELSGMNETERADYVEKYGLEAYTRLVRRDSDNRVAEMRRKRRGF